jgi:hypothetical protein
MYLVLPIANKLGLITNMLGLIANKSILSVIGYNYI